MHSLEIKVANASGVQVPLKTVLYELLCTPFASPETAPFFEFLAGPKNASLMWAFMYVGLLYVVVYGMYRKKWFLRF